MTVTVIADCPEGATSAKAYKDGRDFGVAYIVDGKVTKTFAEIPEGDTHVYGLSVFYADVESESAEIEFSAIVETKILTVDEYVPGTSTYVTGTYQGTLAKRIGLYVDNTHVYSVPLIKSEYPKFKYYKADLTASEKVQVYLADENDKELVRADVPIFAPSNLVTALVPSREDIVVSVGARTSIRIDPEPADAIDAEEVLNNLIATAAEPFIEINHRNAGIYDIDGIAAGETNAVFTSGNLSVSIPVVVNEPSLNEMR